MIVIIRLYGKRLKEFTSQDVTAGLTNQLSDELRRRGDSSFADNFETASVAFVESDIHVDYNHAAHQLYGFVEGGSDDARIVAMTVKKVLREVYGVSSCTGAIHHTGNGGPKPIRWAPE